MKKISTYTINKKLANITQNSPSLWLYIVLIVVIILGMGSRIAACFTDFWFDEIWTLFNSNQLESVLQIFTKFKLDNNHHLNTFFFFLFGDQNNWAIYRIPSLVVGIFTIPLVWFVMSRIGRLEAIIASLLTAGSYLMIYFSSEARGYAFVIFFAFATFFTTERYSSNKQLIWAVLSWLCIGFGFLSHSIFIFVFIAVILWLPFQEIKRKEKWLSIIVDNFKCLGVPAALLGFFYFFVIRQMQIGGGDPYRLIDILVQTLSYAGGVDPAFHMLSVFVSVAVVSFFIWAIIRLWQKGKSEWIFFITVIFIAPATVFIVHKPEILFVRYFLISIFFGYIVSSYLLADIYRKSRSGRIFVSIILLLFLLANGLQVIKLLNYGRGGYLKAMHYIAENTPPREDITIATDHPFRNGMIIEYYKRFLPKEKKIITVYRYKDPFIPQWIIFHYFDKPDTISKTIKDSYNHSFTLSKIFDYAGPSGWGWIIYKKAELK
jgi:hypothetical protein